MQRKKNVQVEIIEDLHYRNTGQIFQNKSFKRIHEIQYSQNSRYS